MASTAPVDERVKQLESELAALKAQMALFLTASQASPSTGASSASSVSSGFSPVTPLPTTSASGTTAQHGVHLSPNAAHSLSFAAAAAPHPPGSPGPGEYEYDGSQQAKDELSIEEKKNMKRVLISKKQLAELKRQRSIKLSDLVRIPSKASAAPVAAPSAPKDTTLLGDWPLELVLVRHGQSEGNEAVARSQRGDLSAYTPEFKNKHSSTYRLTDKGIEQAKVAGQWIRENIGDKFDRY